MTTTKKFKTFAPKIDSKRRLVMTRIYTGVKGSNSFYYTIHRITKKGTIDKRYKHLFAYGTDDFKSIDGFSHSLSGKSVRVFKTAFKSVFKVKEKCDPLSVWNTNKQTT